MWKSTIPEICILKEPYSIYALKWTTSRKDTSQEKRQNTSIQMFPTEYPLLHGKKDEHYICFWFTFQLQPLHWLHWQQSGVYADNCTVQNYSSKKPFRNWEKFPVKTFTKKQTMATNVNSLFAIVLFFCCFCSMHKITYMVYSELNGKECRRALYPSESL